MIVLINHFKALFPAVFVGIGDPQLAVLLLHFGRFVGLEGTDQISAAAVISALAGIQPTGIGGFSCNLTGQGVVIYDAIPIVIPLIPSHKLTDLRQTECQNLPRSIGGQNEIANIELPFSPIMEEK